MFVRYTVDDKDRLNTIMSVDEVVEFVKEHDKLEFYRGVRFSAQLRDKLYTQELFLRFDDIFESKLTEIKLKRLGYLTIKRAKWEDDIAFKASIKVSKVTRDFLSTIGRKGDSYEDILFILLEEYYKHHERPDNIGF